ncbi:STAS domain-containing protein [Fibrisoma montanum]|uniref:STAS domain-containing protein n=1 Tax=Fibrisoma montanum TaxID=2305895 RepID=A0A418MFL2_9BACT|nr:STAS domain-containing protein [Fibrisoma montanum]RIV25513.1 STAS domain-containing protein [Fibrisoma montanum]
MEHYLSDLLRRQKKRLLEQWIQNQLASSDLRDDLMSSDELRAQSEEVIDALTDVLSEKNITNPQSTDFQNLSDLLAGISISRARQGFTPRETGMFVLSLKDTLLDVLQSELADDPVRLHDLTMKISKLIDNFSVSTFETYIKGREDIISRQTSEITDISTPVIQVWDGIVAMPLIGTLDSARTQVVMENLLQAIVETGSSIAILDISGVPTVDTRVAQHLIKTVSATRLMGAECIISGIRPEIAQIVIHLGIDLSNIVTKASLAKALQHAFGMLRLVVRKQDRDLRSA